MVTHKGFSAMVFGVQCPWCGLHAQNVSALNGNNVRFPVWRENQMIGDSTRTKKWKLHIKWLPLATVACIQVGTVCKPRKCNSLWRNFFLHFFFGRFFFQSPSLAWFSLVFPHPTPHHFSRSVVFGLRLSRYPLVSFAAFFWDVTQCLRDSFLLVRNDNLF